MSYSLLDNIYLCAILRNVPHFYPRVAWNTWQKIYEQEPVFISPFKNMIELTSKCLKYTYFYTQKAQLGLQRLSELGKDSLGLQKFSSKSEYFWFLHVEFPLPLALLSELLQYLHPHPSVMSSPPAAHSWTELGYVLVGVLQMLLSPVFSLITDQRLAVSTCACSERFF